MRYVSLAALATMMLTGTALAQDATVLTGKAAFGGWKDDRPGVMRHIVLDDLEPASLDASSSNSAQPVKRPADTVPQVPEGYSVELVASGIENSRAIRFAPNGDLFVANSRAGSVLVLHFGADGAQPEKHTFANGLNQPYGIAFYPAEDPQWVYVAESDGLKRFAYRAGDVEAGKAETILQGIPPNHHWTRDVVFSPDGQTMFYSVGSGSNVGDGTMDAEPKGGIASWASGHALGAAWGAEAGRAEVRTYTPTGEGEKVFATGVRNCAGMTLQPQTGQVWCVVNERDAIGDNTPFEYAAALKEGTFYGWPWYYNGDHPDPRWAKQPREDLAGKVAVGDVLFQAHSAPLNIAFDPSDAWGADIKGDAFVTFHGSWNRGTRTGYKIVRLPIDETGKPTGEYEDFVTGFVLSDQNVWGRPVGVAFDKNGDLYFSEDGNGTIWRVSKK